MTVGLLQKALVDCSKPLGTPTTVAPLTADEVAAYNAQQPIGQAQAAADAAVAALKAKHTRGLGQIKAALTANSALMDSDIAAAVAIVTTLQAGGTLTPSQQMVYDRLVLRVLAVLLGG